MDDRRFAMMKKQTVVEIKRAAKKMDFHPDVATIHSLSDSLLEAIDLLDAAHLNQGERHEVRLGLDDLRNALSEGIVFAHRHTTTGSVQTMRFFDKAVLISELIDEMLTAPPAPKWRKRWDHYQPRIKEEFDE
jgi:hypothetical protein